MTIALFSSECSCHFFRNEGKKTVAYPCAEHAGNSTERMFNDIEEGVERFNLHPNFMTFVPWEAGLNGLLEEIAKEVQSVKIKSLVQAVMVMTEDMERHW